MYQPSGPADTFEMRAGDVLYIPRGGMHSARCLDEESLHLTISLSSLSMVTLLERELRHLANRNEALRRRVPWTFAGDPEETEAVRQTLRGWLRVFSEELDPARVINETREQLKRQETGPANLLSEAIAGLRGRAREGEMS
jgi:ribosomal protein L16 Arg81 hydroxylase